uniref:Uncharacterized protein n=1 Tax=Timema poppense TaxID=170557 RepID=A0A7R9CZD5_TIMPO|nr:unnamed protein product [Timema poppensis]
MAGLDHLDIDFFDILDEFVEEENHEVVRIPRRHIVSGDLFNVDQSTGERVISGAGHASRCGRQRLRSATFNAHESGSVQEEPLSTAV